MRLRTLLQGLDQAQQSGAPDREISLLTHDSRLVEPGALFVAVRGGSVDGHRYLQAAVRKGAVVLVGEEPDPGLGVPYLRVGDSRLALAELAAAWHGYPAHEMVMVGVTGTDGKTTTANLLHAMLRAANHPVGMITTVNAVIGDRTLDTGCHVTTPGALEVQAYLADMLRSGMSHCILEATSHGLAQHRVAACAFDVALLTNITHEHLDFHGSYDAYRKAKASLFQGLAGTPEKKHGLKRAAILNRDDSSYDFMKQQTSVRQISYGWSERADVCAYEVRTDRAGTWFTIAGPGYREQVYTPLLGEYNVGNCLAAFTAAVEALGLPPEAAAQGMAQLKAIPGRMEPIEAGQPFAVLIDFAHTPNALQRALTAARSLTRGRVIVVFGSAGLRDREKRRIMAEVAIDLADLAVLTAEDPRTESLEAILEEMAAGARKRGGREGDNFVRIPDRREALRFALQQARPDDLVLACGKGHEQSMCFGETEYPWDERQAVQAALAEILGIDGPPMPFLPDVE